MKLGGTEQLADRRDQILSLVFMGLFIGGE